MMKRFAFITALLAMLRQLLTAAPGTRIDISQVRPPAGPGLYGFETGNSEPVTLDPSLTLAAGILKITTPAPAAPIFVIGEIPLPTTGNSFSLAFTPVAGSTQLHMNGLRQSSAGATPDFTLSGNVVTLTFALPAGSALSVDYRR